MSLSLDELRLDHGISGGVKDSKCKFDSPNGERAMTCKESRVSACHWDEGKEMVWKFARSSSWAGASGAEMPTHAIDFFWPLSHRATSARMDPRHSSGFFGIE